MKKSVCGHTAEECFVLTQKYGAMCVGRGMFLTTASRATADQLGWEDEDARRHMDFGIAAYWLLTNDWPQPIGINTESELEEFANFEEEKGAGG